MTEGILLAIIGIAEAVITAFITFFLTKRKYNVEVEGGKIENQGSKIDNDKKDLEFYINMVEDNKAKLDELQQENREQRREIAEMRSVVFSMLQQICTDMMCQSRVFDKEKCPYLEVMFKETKTEQNNEED